MSTLLICNAQIVNEGSIQQADVFVRDGRIVQIGSSLSHLSSDRFLNAAGLHLMPGMIDSQFSLGNTEFDIKHLKTEVSAAVAGGITSSLLLPSSQPSAQLVAAEVDDELLESLSGKLVSNLAYYKAIKKEDLDSLETLGLKHSCGIFASMSTTDDLMRFDDPEQLQTLFTQSPILVALHAESAPIIFENEESYRQIYGDEIPLHLHSNIRSEEACVTAAREALTLAEDISVRLHLLHLSSEAEVELIESFREKNKNITADVCAQFLSFCESDYMSKGAQLKYSPAIKTDIDRAALMQGLLDNNISHICSGHILVSKKAKKGSYFDVQPGLPQAQFTLPSILEHYQDEILSLESVVQNTSHAVADAFAIEDRGYIREGYWADFVLVDIERSFIARNEDVISGAGWTIFNGNEFRSSVMTTIVNGQVVWKNGAFTDALPSGQLLRFIR